MKKIFLLITTILTAVSVMSAQDLNKAIEAANNGNDAFQLGEYELALEAFRNSLTIAESLGETGAAHAETCKSAICNIYMAMAKKQYNEKNFESAIATFKKTQETAAAYGKKDVADEAAELAKNTQINIYNSAAAEAKKAKDFATAIANYGKVLEIDPENGTAAFQLGDAFYRTKNWDNAVKYLLFAKDNGQEKNATKLLSQVYLKQAQEALRAKNYEAVLDFTAKSNEFVENGNAYKLAASAAQKLGKTQDSIDFYDKYLAVSPKAKDASGVICTIAVLYQQSGNKAKAIEYYQKIVSDPQFGAQAQEQLKALK